MFTYCLYTNQVFFEGQYFFSLSVAIKITQSFGSSFSMPIHCLDEKSPNFLSRRPRMNIFCFGQTSAFLILNCCVISSTPNVFLIADSSNVFLITEVPAWTRKTESLMGGMEGNAQYLASRGPLFTYTSCNPHFFFQLDNFKEIQNLQN